MTEPARNAQHAHLQPLQTSAAGAPCFCWPSVLLLLLCAWQHWHLHMRQSNANNHVTAAQLSMCCVVTGAQVEPLLVRSLLRQLLNTPATPRHSVGVTLHADHSCCCTPLSVAPFLFFDPGTVSSSALKNSSSSPMSMYPPSPPSSSTKSPAVSREQHKGSYC